jgi:hypothetical protein
MSRDVCACCRYPGAPIVVRPDQPPLFDPLTGDPVDLCDVCYRSMVGTWYLHRKTHDPVKVELGRLIAWGVNHLKDVPGPEKV